MEALNYPLAIFSVVFLVSRTDLLIHYVPRFRRFGDVETLIEYMRTCRPFFAELLCCSWCLGFWVALALRFVPEWVLETLAGLAIGCFFFRLYRAIPQRSLTVDPSPQ